MVAQSQAARFALKRCASILAEARGSFGFRAQASAGRLLPRTFASMPATDSEPVEDAEFYPHGMKSLTPEHRMADTLKRLGTVRVEPMESSRFIKPQSIFFELDGKERRWDMVGSMPSVGSILYHREMNAVLLVRQFRPPVYVAAATEAASQGLPPPPLSVGFTYELCAGLIDKTKSREQIVKEEIMEECGYDVPLDHIRFVTSYVAASGSSGVRQRVYTAEVDGSMLKQAGGGVKADGEAIEVLALPVDRMMDVMGDDSLSKSAALPLAFLWVNMQLQRNGGTLLGHAP